ncbi:MAG: CAP domain-containing protein, partial [Acidimicrobiia bacterium]
YALVTVSILVMALTAVMMEGAPAPDTVSVEALRIEATTTSTPTRAISNPEATTTSTTVIQIQPDTDALGNPVGDLHPTTTTTAQAAEHSSAMQTAKNITTPTTQPKTVTTQAPAAQASPSPTAESEFAGKINSYRSSNGLAALNRDGSLDASARAWAENLAANGKLSHSDLGRLLPPWSAAGENVGTGGSVGSIFDALVGSSGHRANMLGDYTHMGVGVFVDGAGRLWAVHLFTR